jgi:hypothetical protein
VKFYAEKVSGIVTDRKALPDAINADRDAARSPARSTRDLLLNIRDALGAAGAGFKSLADTWADGAGT